MMILPRLKYFLLGFAALLAFFLIPEVIASIWPDSYYAIFGGGFVGTIISGILAVPIFKKYFPHSEGMRTNSKELLTMLAVFIGFCSVVIALVFSFNYYF